MLGKSPIVETQPRGDKYRAGFLNRERELQMTGCLVETTGETGQIEFGRYGDLDWKLSCGRRIEGVRVRFVGLP